MTLSRSLRSLMLLSILPATVAAGPVTGVEYWSTSTLFSGFVTTTLDDSTGGSTYSNTFTGTAGDSVTVSGSSRPDYGILHSYSSLSVSNAARGTWYQFVTRAWSLDQLTIVEPGLGGTSGFITVGMTFDGSTSYNANRILNTSQFPPAGVFMTISGTIPDAAGRFHPAGTQGAFTGTSGYTIYGSVPMTFGLPFDLFLQVGTYGSLMPVGQNTAGWNGNAIADFSQTAILTSVTVNQGSVSSPGAAVTDFQIQSASGTNYSATGVVTPEPGTSLLLMGGFALAGFLRRIQTGRLPESLHR